MPENPDLLTRLSQRLAWLGQRQGVLAENVANADTPNYRPKDIAPLSFSDQLSTTRLAVTNPGHLGGVGSGRLAPSAILEVPETQASPSGNRINIEEQLATIAENGLTHRAISEIYRKYGSWLSRVAGSER